MKVNFGGQFLLLGAAIMLPSITLAQFPTPEAPIEWLSPPAAQDPASPPRQPAAPLATLRSTTQEPSTPPASPAAPARAVRSRSATSNRSVEAPEAVAPVFSPATMNLYTQAAPYYRYNVPLDKEMQEFVKKEAELAKKTAELVAGVKAAAADKKAEIRTQLLAVVEEHFSLRQSQRELQLKRIEEEVKKLRDAIEKRNTSKKEIIERRIAELTGEDTIGF
jgi:hypothetical protein